MLISFNNQFYMSKKATTKLILKELASQGELTASELTNRLHKTFSVVLKALKKLTEDDAICKSSPGRYGIKR